MTAIADRAAAALPVGVLVTKLRPPRTRDAAPPRDRLLARLRPRGAERVALVTGGAGFGKSTLLAHWVRTLDRHVAWVSLDDGDNDVARFWSHVLAALEPVAPTIAADGIELLRTPRAPPLEAILTELLNELAAAEDTVLVLDDYHLVDHPDIHGGVSFLLDHLPEAVLVGIGSRTVPPLPLARLRGRGELLEVGADALRATFDEAEDFLRTGMGLALDETAVRRVLERTEGWFAGLQLAALALRGREDDPASIDGFGGQHRLVLEYLTEEVLRGQSPAVQRFLLESSLLSRMSAPLCDAILGRDDGAAMLAHVDAANLFAVSLDGTGTWWRYHQLFADLLRARLERTEPDRARELHRAAARAFEGSGDTAEAIRHHLEAGDGDRAATLVASAAEGVLKAGGVATLQRWLGSVPRDAFAHHPGLAITEAWCALLSGASDRVAPLLAEAEAAIARAGDGAVPSVRRVRAQVAAVRAHVVSIVGRAAEATELAEAALAGLDDADHWLRANLLLSLGLARQRAEDLAGAAEATEASALAFAGAGSRYGWLHATAQLGEIRRFQGHLTAARRTFDEALAGGPLERTRREPVLGHVLSGLAKVALERYDLDHARELAERGVAAAAAFELAARVDALLTLALVHTACGESAEAEAVYVRVLRETAPSPRFAWAQLRVSTFRAALAITDGRLADAAAWRAGLDEAMLRPAYQERHLELVTTLRLALAEGDLGALERQLETLIPWATRAGVVGQRLDLLALRVLLELRRGHDDEAATMLAAALDEAAVEGHVRPFLASGPGLLPLLGRLAGDGHAHARRVREAAEAAGMAPPGAAAGAPGRDAHGTGPDRAGSTAPRGTGFAPPDAHHEPLTDRERTVLRLLAAGASNKAIAKELNLSVNTVKTHVRTIYGKLGVSSRAKLAALVHGVHASG